MAKQHRGTTEDKSPTDYHVEANPHFKPRSGEWAGKFVPTKNEKQKKASQENFAKQMNKA